MIFDKIENITGPLD